jgi:periplasmic mercuric ion binding protein
MNTLKIFSTLLVCCAIATTSFSQKTKTDTFQVSGNCGMCEAKIEKAAKAAGATYAEWNKDSKIITVKYNSTSSNLAKIQKSIAAAGYDNVGVKATTEAYDKLHACCKYDRTESNQAKACCDNEKCTKEDCAGTDCCKDGKCTMQACKDAGCCKDGKCDMTVCAEKGCCKKS